MSNLVDIIVTHYKEKSIILERLLKSINEQLEFDFNELKIILVSDGAPAILGKDLRKKYEKLNIVYILNPVNQGPGLARQVGLDHSEAKYVTFYDCDDEMFGNYVLHDMINRMEENNDNVLVTSVLEEVMMNGQMMGYKHQPNFLQGLHGLFIKRQYLLDMGIKFHENLRHAEDSYFYRCVCYTTQIDAMDYVTYKWNYNDESIVRRTRDKDYSVVAFEDHMNQIEYTYDFVNKVGCAYGQDFIDIYLIKSIFGLHMLIESVYFSAPNQVREQIQYSLNVKRLYKKYKEVFDKYDEKTLKLHFADQYLALVKTNPEIKMPKDVMEFVNSYRD